MRLLGFTAALRRRAILRFNGTGRPFMGAPC